MIPYCWNWTHNEHHDTVSPQIEILRRTTVVLALVTANKKRLTLMPKDLTFFFFLGAICDGKGRILELRKYINLSRPVLSVCSDKGNYKYLKPSPWKLNMKAQKGKKNKKEYKRESSKIHK